MITILQGDCLEVMRTLPDNSVDSIVTDPPAGISFMGKEWDHDLGGRDKWIEWMTTVAKECLRVLKPGAHALVWSLPRTSHWTATAWENAGFECRDRIAHCFGSGFPKSSNISKILDRAEGIEREDKFEGSFNRRAGPTGNKKCEICGKWLVSGSPCQCPRPQDAAISDSAKQWDGWGTALKPAIEDWWLLRKPLSESTIAANVIRHGCGAINIDRCRVPLNGDYKCGANGRPGQTGLGDNYDSSKANQHSEVGRFPANLIHDGSDEVVGLFPITSSGAMKREVGAYDGNSTTGFLRGRSGPSNQHGDNGSAARFFYCAKASRSERGEDNKHPCVKPLALMRYLCRLITPHGGTILDPFAGSGTTGVAAIQEGFNCILIERELEYVDIIRRRTKIEPDLFTPKSG